MEKTDIPTVLSHSQLFNGIESSALEDLISKGKIIQYKAKEAIVWETKPVQGLNVIIHGSVQIVKSEKAAVTQLGRGSFFGEISLFGMSFGATATVMSIGASTVFVITKSELASWFKKFPAHEVKFLRHLAHELCNRLYSTTEKL
jgi:signal-transduction protein with cAMP-binding, CBS, and nucleotidyltransferase domain